MALRNADFDRITRIYADRRYANARAAQEKTAKIFAAHPEIAALNEKIRASSAARAKALLSGRLKEAEACAEETARQREEKDALLQSFGLSETDFQPVYTCKDCRDTGFINGEKCRCFKQEEIRLLYEDSHLGEVLLRENFDRLSDKWYDRAAKDGKPSEHARMTAIADRVRRYADSFENAGGSLLFYGPAGSGKTFFTNCIAKALLDRGRSVVYFSAVSLFERMSALLQQHDAEASENLTDTVLSSDLLIIDDLGTEFLNSYTVSRFFQIINERIRIRKSTVISTNLSLSGLKERYTERIASRILSEYELIHTDCADIRLRKKFEK